MKKMINVVILMSLYLPSNLWAAHVLDIMVVEYPPFMFTNTDTNTMDGKVINVVEAVFKRMEQQIELRIVPWSRGLKLLREGKADGVIEIFKNAERQTYLDFSHVSLMNEVVSFFVVEDSKIRFDGDLAQLSQYHFGARQDYSYGSEFDGAVTDKVISNLSLYVELERLLLELCTGELDIVIGERHVVAYRESLLKGLKTHSIKRCKKIKELSPSVQSTPAYIAFSKKRELIDIRDNFDKILTKMKQDGSYQKIIDEFDVLH
ncbi:transporter substrate-binding domain-containing protein [Shewanella sp. VB17]|uniref:substrate-binding periplasmic protein n=1 Tax=Shewanella sp. VB17 TaxID=2739432 RepID=UPI0015636FFA|nr:transporter substrate-binding domain-containing protein [Shewanella sp. VB17]NRD73190.1 transporter substrate-binding domain-containing protein [Shewanella sp. VB17]